MSTATFVRYDESKIAHGKQSERNYYFGDRHDVGSGPEGFMLKFAPSAGLPAHFHDVNQYQVFYGSPGAKFQRHQIPTLMVHYSAAGTLYGPFTAGTEVPLQMLTLRQAGSQFTGLMPDNREQLAAPDKRKHLEVELSSWLDDPLPSANEHLCNAIFPLQNDGVAAFSVIAGARAELDQAGAGTDGGRYYVVIEGEMIDGDRVLPTLSIGWSPSGAGECALRAGDSGLRLLILKFAAPA